VLFGFFCAFCGRSPISLESLVHYSRSDDTSLSPPDVPRAEIESQSSGSVYRPAHDDGKQIRKSAG